VDLSSVGGRLLTVDANLSDIEGDLTIVEGVVFNVEGDLSGVGASSSVVEMARTKVVIPPAVRLALGRGIP